MKIRSDFVTNSSSSSFIVSFSGKRDMKKCMEEIGVYGENYSNRVYEDIIENMITRATVIKRYRKLIESDVHYQLVYGDWNTKGPYYDKPIEWLRGKEFEAILKREIDNRVELFNDRLCKKGIYAIVEYGDEDGPFFSELEHEIMPYVSFTFERISHH